MAILKTEAIVLRTFDFRETSLIAHFFTRGYGRINGILKGIRAEPGKFASTLEPFSLNEIIFYRKRNSELHLVSHCDLIDNFNNIRCGLNSIACASYLTDLVARLTALEDKNEGAYELFSRALEQMDRKENEEKVTRVFLIKFLKLIGFKPRLDGCVVCDADIMEAAYFNARSGGLLCPACKNKDEWTTTVMKGTVASILHLEQSNWQEALRLGLNSQIKTELNRILQSFMEFHLEIRPKSRELLNLLSY